MHKALIVSAPQGQPCSGKPRKAGLSAWFLGESASLCSAGQASLRAEEIKHRNTDDLT